MNITNDIRYVGVNDRDIDLFEGQYPVPNGMSYNSYVVMDDKIAVLDTADERFFDEWSDRVKKELNGRGPDYLIVSHMEPDHSAHIARFMNAYPSARVAATAKAFEMMEQFFAVNFDSRRVIVSDGYELSLGKHTLKFITAPMVHWPEVTTVYDAADKVLFSADGFGKFGALDARDNWTDEARRYYIGIVGKYGAQVQSLLKKVSALDIDIICPLHGPVLTGDLSPYLNLYNLWSSYKPEIDGCLVAYTSVYGNTKKAAEYLAERMRAEGCGDVICLDLARADMSEVVAQAFRRSKLALATTTYNADIFPHMRTFISHLTERAYQNRKVAIVENGSWAPAAAKVISGLLEKSKGLNIISPAVTIKSALNDESRRLLDAAAAELARN